MCWVGHFVPRSGETLAPGCPWLSTSQSHLPWGVVKSQSCQADWGRAPSACAGVVGLLQGAGRDGRHCHGLLLLPYLRTVHLVSMQPQPSYGKQANRWEEAEPPHSSWPPKPYTVRDLLLASCILLCLLYNHTTHVGVQHGTAASCTSNDAAWIYVLTSYTTPHFCLL